MIQLLALLLSAGMQGAPERLELAPLFGDHMVLQCDVQASIWGKAPKDAPMVRVELHADGSPALPGIVAKRSDTRWSASLPAQAAGGPWTVRIDAGPAG